MYGPLPVTAVVIAYVVGSILVATLVCEITQGLSKPMAAPTFARAVDRLAEQWCWPHRQRVGGAGIDVVHADAGVSDPDLVFHIDGDAAMRQPPGLVNTPSFRSSGWKRAMQLPEAA